MLKMNLKDFISDTLTQIAEGVVQAQQTTKDTGAMINPAVGRESQEVRVKGSFSSLQTVEFDIGLALIEDKNSKGGLGIVSGIFNVGGATGSESSEHEQARVKFSVPMTLPPNR